MTDLLISIENSGIATWTRESSSLLAYPAVLTLHTFGLAIVVGFAGLLDLRLRGYGRRVPLGSLMPFFPIIWGAFAVNAATGVLLWMTAATTKTFQPVFHIKLVLIAVAVLGTVRIERLLERGSRGAGDAVTPPVRNWALASLALWVAAIVAGRLMAYL